MMFCRVICEEVESGSRRRQRLSMLSAQAKSAAQCHEYTEMIGQFLSKFDTKLSELIEQLTERATGIHESHMINLCTRLDYNNYYRDKRRSKSTSPSNISRSTEKVTPV